MSAAVPYGSASVTLTDRHVLVRQMSLSDPDVVAAAHAAQARGDDLDSWLQLLVRTGAVATAAAGTGADLARVERALAQVSTDVGSTVTAALAQLQQRVHAAADPDSGMLAVASKQAVDRLSHGVQNVLVGKGALLPEAVRLSVKGLTDGALAEINRLVAAQSAATLQSVQADRDLVRQAVVSVVEQRHAEIRNALTELSHNVALATVRRQDRAASSKAGGDFELVCLDLLTEVAQGCADTVEHTARVRGREGNSVGDITVELAGFPGGVRRMVVEAKARKGSSRPSSKTLRDELRTARRNRGAMASIALCPPERMPGGDARIVILEQCSVAVRVDPQDPDLDLLRAAYLLCRLAALSDTVDPGSETDLELVRHQLVELRAAVDEIDALERHIGSAHTALSKIRAGAGDLRAKLLDRLQQISMTLLGPPAGDDEPLELAVADAAAAQSEQHEQGPPLPAA